MMVELITITIWFFINLSCIPGISGPFSKWRSWFTRFLWYWAFSCEGFLFLKYLTVNARSKIPIQNSEHLITDHPEKKFSFAFLLL